VVARFAEGRGAAQDGGAAVAGPRDGIARGALAAVGAELECDAVADGGVDAVKAGLGASEEPAVSQGAVAGVPAADGFGEESAVEVTCRVRISSCCSLKARADREAGAAGAGVARERVPGVGGAGPCEAAAGASQSGVLLPDDVAEVAPKALEALIAEDETAEGAPGVKEVGVEANKVGETAKETKGVAGAAKEKLGDTATGAGRDLEGAGILLLEELEHAKARGAESYVEFLGHSFTCDAYHRTEPHPDGAGMLLCIEKALAQSGVNRVDVNYVNAHATSTKAGDLNEYKALIKAFGGNSELKVNSTKSMVGHLLGAAGAVEAIATIQAIRTGWVNPTINLEDPESEADMNVIVGGEK
jgi:hypothetical protein